MNTEDGCPEELSDKLIADLVLNEKYVTEINPAFAGGGKGNSSG